jgi:hypothetical protein
LGQIPVAEIFSPAVNITWKKCNFSHKDSSVEMKMPSHYTWRGVFRT